MGTELISETLPSSVVRKQAIYRAIQTGIAAILLAVMISTLFIVLHNQDPTRSNHIQDCVDPAGECLYDRRLQNADLLARQTYCDRRYPHGSYAVLEKCLRAGVVDPATSSAPPTNSKAA